MGQMRLIKCLSKKKHINKADAEQVIYIIQKRRPNEPMFAYACEFCRGWHIGHGRQGQKSKKRKVT